MVTAAELLRQDLRQSKNPFLPTDKSAQEICEELKAAGLPYGKIFVSRWLRAKLDAKPPQAVCIEGFVPNERGRSVRACKYRFLQP